MGKAVVYLRVSTVDQVQNYSLDTQLRACLDYCAREGLDVDRVFREEGESAKSADRSQLTDLLKYCAVNAKKRGVTHLIVHRVDRLSRVAADYGAIRRALETLGVKVRAVQETFDESPAGRLVENLMASLAQFDNDARAARTRDGMMAGLAQGRWMFRPPLGYIGSETNRQSPSLRPDPARADLVRMAFDLVATGTSRSAALKQVTALGLRSRKGHALSPQSFSNLLRNPAYAGLLVVASWEFEGPGDFEPLISLDTFQRAQHSPTGASSDGDTRQRDHPDFPLRRIVRCGHCAGPLTGSWSRGRNALYPYYRCHRKGCGKVNVRKERLEELFETQLVTLSARPEAFELLAAVTKDALSDRNKRGELTRSALCRRRDDVEQRRNRVVDAFLHLQSIDQPTYERQMERLAAEQVAIDDELMSLQSCAIPYDETLRRAALLLSDVSGCWNRLSAQQRPAFVASIFPDGLTFDEEGIGTGDNSWLFGKYSADSVARDGLAARTGFEPVPPP